MKWFPFLLALAWLIWALQREEMHCQKVEADDDADWALGIG